jgi:DnaJ-class molecular chaperone
MDGAACGRAAPQTIPGKAADTYLDGTCPRVSRTNEPLPQCGGTGISSPHLRALLGWVGQQQAVCDECHGSGTAQAEE